MAALVPASPGYTQPFQLRVLIVGAGIAGLSCAIELRTRLNCQVTVIERAAKLQDWGASIGLAPNAGRILKSWDVYDSLPMHYGGLVTGTCFHGADGTELLRAPADGDCDISSVLMRRSDLVRALCDRALDEGVELLFDTQLAAAEWDTMLFQLSNGSTLQADLVVAADGINSSLRRQYWPSSAALKTPLAYIVWELEAVHLQACVETAALLHEPASHFWLNDGCCAGLFPHNGGQRWTVILMPQKRQPGLEDAQYGQPVPLQVVQDAASRLDPCVQALASLATDTCKPFAWPVSETPPLSRWSTHQGRLVLIGDAAHAMKPMLGQGAGMALEDAAALGELLEAAQQPSDLEWVLPLFDELRQPRLAALRAMTEQMSHLVFLADGPERRKRDERYRFVSSMLASGQKRLDEATPDPKAAFNSREGRAYVIGYDVRQEAKALVEEALGGNR